MANFKAIAGIGALVFVLYVAAQVSPLRSQSESPADTDIRPSIAASTRQPVETYRLIHAIGNSESIVGRGLSEGECDTQKAELKVTATALGTYNEALGRGSIACLPEGTFD